jgi:hypothetical protein
MIPIGTSIMADHLRRCIIDTDKVSVVHCGPFSSFSPKQKAQASSLQ